MADLVAPDEQQAVCGYCLGPITRGQAVHYLGDHLGHMHRSDCIRHAAQSSLDALRTALHMPEASVEGMVKAIGLKDEEITRLREQLAEVSRRLTDIHSGALSAAESCCGSYKQTLIGENQQLTQQRDELAAALKWLTARKDREIAELKHSDASLQQTIVALALDNERQQQEAAPDA